jgi:hypothetical protein
MLEFPLRIFAIAASVFCAAREEHLLPCYSGNVYVQPGGELTVQVIFRLIRNLWHNLPSLSRADKEPTGGCSSHPLVRVPVLTFVGNEMEGPAVVGEVMLFVLVSAHVFDLFGRVKSQR